MGACTCCVCSHLYLTNKYTICIIYIPTPSSPLPPLPSPSLTPPEHGIHRGVWVDGRLRGVRSPRCQLAGHAHQLPRPLSIHVGAAQRPRHWQRQPQGAPPPELHPGRLCLLHEVGQRPLPRGSGQAVLARGPDGDVGWGRRAGQCHRGTAVQRTVGVLPGAHGHRRLYGRGPPGTKVSHNSDRHCCRLCVSAIHSECLGVMCVCKV